METQKVKNGMRYEKNGWTYLSIEGSAKERGYANGYLMAPELREIFKMLDFNFYNDYGYSRVFFSDLVNELYGPRIKKNYPELYEEIEYITIGYNAAVPDSKIRLADIIMWNCYVSIDYLMGSLPNFVNENKDLKEKYGYLFRSKSGQSTSSKAEGGGTKAEGGGTKAEGRGAKDHCTAFIAVGSYTKDGKIVCAHNSFDNFIDGQYFNVMLSMKPEKGHQILMQTAPGCISSGTDYYVTSAGLICAETTIGGFNKFKLLDPICCRIRTAMQYGTTLDDCLKYLKHNNGGDYANSWLIGDTKINTIMRIELGLEYINVEKKTDGYFIGFNAADDPRIRNLECTNTGYYDIRRHQGARRVRLTELMQQYKGKIDIKIGQKILADHYDVYLKKINPCSRTCCSHYDLDDRAFMSQSDRPKPYQPRGALDGIVCDSTMAKKMSLVARWGSSCGMPFNKTKYCNKHIQWKEQEPYLHDRPTRPWTIFSSLSEKKREIKTLKQHHHRKLVKKNNNTKKNYVKRNNTKKNYVKR